MFWYYLVKEYFFYQRFGVLFLLGQKVSLEKHILTDLAYGQGPLEYKCNTDGNDGGFDFVIFLAHIATHSELPTHSLVSLFKYSSS